MRFERTFLQSLNNANFTSVRRCCCYMYVRVCLDIRSRLIELNIAMIVIDIIGQYGVFIVI